MTMKETEIQEILTQLANGELTEFYVTKADFLAFRQVLVKREDFKHFVGIAGRGGDALYRYAETPRS